MGPAMSLLASGESMKSTENEAVVDDGSYSLVLVCGVKAEPIPPHPPSPCLADLICKGKQHGLQLSHTKSTIRSVYLIKHRCDLGGESASLHAPLEASLARNLPSSPHFAGHAKPERVTRFT